MKKMFVLDTNVLLHSSASIQCFKDNDVVIPMTVIEELDKFKKNSDELGRNARRVIRLLDRLREEFPGCTGDGSESCFHKPAHFNVYYSTVLEKRKRSVKLSVNFFLL